MHNSFGKILDLSQFDMGQAECSRGSQTCFLLLQLNVAYVVVLWDDAGVSGDQWRRMISTRMACCRSIADGIGSIGQSFARSISP